MNRLVQLNGFDAKLLFLFTAQINEYKLVFAEALTWLQFGLLGHIDFKAISAISNAFVLLLALLLWKMFLPVHKDLGSRLALFVPASWLLFQLQYFEILNWGGAGLQHLPSTVFAFSAIHLLFRTTRKAFCCALACYILAIASSGNGFLLLPVGLIVLFINRRYGRIAAWVIASAICIVVYFYHYNVMSSQASPDHSILSALRRLQPIYIISFIGSAAGIPFPLVSFVLGTTLLLFFLWMVRRGYVQRNPAVSCCVLFLLLSAVGAVGIRSDMGLAESVSSRFTFFSILFVILAWFMIAEEFVQYIRTSLLNSGVYLSAVMIAICFCLSSDAIGSTVQGRWDRKIAEGMADFEHPTSPDSTRGPVIPLWDGDYIRETLNPRARAALIESIRLGVYHPPKL